MGIELGEILDGKYRVTARIGEGGMGAVYAGEHLKLHRKVAIKVLHASVATDPEVVMRFEREAQAAGRIGNDHILEVFDIGELPGGDRYMVMEFLDGEPMNARLSRLGRMTPQQLYPLVRQMLEGLAAAHAAGIVHRDLKPANIFILRQKLNHPDYVKLIDFGISKFQAIAGDVPHNQTRTGTIIGTPSYMSPEQARGLRDADLRSDIYAVGVILYEAVSGRVPFEGVSTADLLFQIFMNEPPPIETLARDVDPAFCTIIMKALAKEPRERFTHAEEFSAALDAWAQTGRGVSVIKPSPNAIMSATLLERPGAGPRLNAATLPATQGSWAESPPVTAPGATARATRAPVVAGIAIGALVLFLGVGALLVANRRSERGAATADPSAGRAHVEIPTATSPPALPVVAPAAAALAEASPEAAVVAPIVIATQVPPVATAPPAPTTPPAAANEVPRKHAHVPPPQAPAATASANCNPPYTIDALAHHVPKPECM